MIVNTPQETPRYDPTWLHPRTKDRGTPPRISVVRLAEGKESLWQSRIYKATTGRPGSCEGVLLQS